MSSTNQALPWRKWHGPIVALSLVALTSWPMAAQDQAQQPDSPVMAPAVAAETAAQVLAYWTAERMESAIPMPSPAVVDPNVGAPQANATLSVPEGEPGYAPGWDPASGVAAPGPDIGFAFPAAAASQTDLAQPQHGVKPTNPRDGPYGPFQRNSLPRRYTSYPTSPVGKLFFTLPSGNFVCSASVIQRNTVVTAGHCNFGSGQFATNRMFCPSYNNGGVNPQRGCWAAVNSKTSAGWVNNGDPDYDYACLIMATSGTVWNAPIGNVTGWFGRAWNFSSRQVERDFGYPAGAPFNGRLIIDVASPEWYEHDFTAGGQVSKIMGNDMTGGSSGGPWILGFNHASAEFADTDGSIETDPGGNWVNGVNSHKRCVGNCQSPPTTTTGVFWQEMTSPPFRNTAAGDETEDNFQVCFANGGV